jgi:hypothetical protein
LTSQRRLPSTPALAVLTRDERATVLARLLASHPDLLTEAEQLALAVLGTDTIEGFADNVAWARGAIELEDLAARSGRVRGRGYVHENEAAWELLTEARPLRSRPSPTNHARSPRLGQRHCHRHRGGPLPIAGTRGRHRRRLCRARRHRRTRRSSLRDTKELGVKIPSDVAEGYWPKWA